MDSQQSYNGAALARDADTLRRIQERVAFERGGGEEEEKEEQEEEQEGNGGQRRKRKLKWIRWTPKLQREHDDAELLYCHLKVDDKKVVKVVLKDGIDVPTIEDCNLVQSDLLPKENGFEQFELACRRIDGCLGMGIDWGSDSTRQEIAATLRYVVDQFHSGQLNESTRYLNHRNSYKKGAFFGFAKGSHLARANRYIFHCLLERERNSLLEWGESISELKTRVQAINSRVGFTPNYSSGPCLSDYMPELGYGEGLL
jgi:hypothetical protein